jgi:hypothetical protein
MQMTWWEHRRERYYLTHARRCERCQTEDGIELHHLSYEHVHAEPDEDLMPLCQRCHAFVHQVHRLSGGSLADATRRTIADLKRPTQRQPRPEPPPALGKDPNAKLSRDPVAQATETFRRINAKRAEPKPRPFVVP